MKRFMIVVGVVLALALAASCAPVTTETPGALTPVGTATPPAGTQATPTIPGVATPTQAGAGVYPARSPSP